MDHSDRFETSMKVLEKRIEVMKKKNEASLIRNEILTLERELRQLELEQERGARRAETSEKKPRRNLPDIPESRRVSFGTLDIPKLHLFDENSIDMSRFTPLPKSTKSSKVEPQTSTPSKVEPQTSTPSKVEPHISTPSKAEPQTLTSGAMQSKKQ